MGRQVYFYMDERDEAEFKEFMSNLGSTILLPGTPSAVPTAQSLLELPPQSQPFWWLVLVVPEALRDGVIFKFVPTQGHYVIDSLDSPVIEFSRSKVGEGTIRRGRIWAELQQLTSDGNRVQKPEVLGKTFERLARFLRSKYRKEGAAYVGPGASRLVEEGFELRQL